MAVTYILCAAGDGTRFKQLIPSIPKPLIKLKGKTLLEWSINSLPVFCDDELFIITQKSHKIKESLQHVIANDLPFTDVKWIELDASTRGQLETAMVAKGLINKSNSIVIYNCDSYFQSSTLLTLMNDSSIEGIIPCSKEPGEAWSFCKINRKNEVLVIKEKTRISAWATVGLYYFRSSELFFNYAEKALASRFEKELFVAPLYQEYIRDGYRVVIDRLKLFKPMGTPDQIVRYWKLSPSVLKKENLINKTLVVDIDNTITIDNESAGYSEKQPNFAVINKLKQYKELGYTIILHTSRRMKTNHNNEAAVVKDIGGITLSWLKKYSVPYDGIKFGKPFASAFIVDDRAIRPSEFIRMTKEQINDLLSQESCFFKCEKPL